MKTTFQYDHYYGYDELKECLMYFQEHYADLCQVTSICTTPKQREVFAVTLSKGDPAAKPAYYIDGNTHAGEVTGSMAAMHTLDYLLTNYKADQQVTEILDRFTIYVLPRISPDGAEVYLTTPYTLRSVDRPYLCDHQEDGLYLEDVDHNGVIAMMRVKDPNGLWRKDPNNDLLMIRRSPDMMDGEFYQIYSEGMVAGEQKDLAPARPLWGLDFNRNYPFGWFTENRQPGAGPYPLSNPENKAVVDFVIAHPNICAGVTHHTSGGIILYPPGTKSAKTAPSKDMRFFKEIGAMATEEMGYGCINIFDSFFEDQSEYSSGAFDDWCYQSRGIPTYTIELWDLENRAGCQGRWPVPKEPKTIQEKMADLGRIYTWVKKYCPEAILPWQTYQHPQLGEVEIGGLAAKFTYQNCPPAFLQQEVEKTTRFSLRMACTLPRLEITAAQVQKIAEDTYVLDLTVANRGYLPTYVTDALLELQLPHALEVTVSGKDITFVSGQEKTQIERLEGFGCINSDFGFGAHIQTQAHAPLEKTLRYVLQAKVPATLKVSVSGSKVGTQEISLTL